MPHPARHSHRGPRRRRHVSRRAALLALVLVATLLPGASNAVRANHRHWGDQAAPAGMETLWGRRPTESYTTPKEPESVELGTAFRARVSGTVVGVRFWKTAGNSGQHQGSLWDSSGRRLASATFDDESSSGWQTVRFDKPVQVRANARYVASYFAPEGNWAVTRYFRGQSSSKYLTVERGISGVYQYGSNSRFPRWSWHSSQYWVDVLFVPEHRSGRTPTPTETPSPTAAPSPSPTSSATDSPDPTPSSTPTETDSPSGSPTTSPTTRPSDSPTGTPSNTPSSTPTSSTTPGSTSGFPTRATTGVPAGWQPKRSVTGDYSITTAGAVVEDLRVTSGVLYVRAPNVTLRRVELVGGRIVNDYARRCYDGLRIEDTSIVRGPNDEGMPVIEAGGYTAVRLKVDGVTEGLRVGEKDYPGCGAVVVQDSYINISAPDRCAAVDWHGDGIQGYRGAELTVRNSYIGIFTAPDCIPTSAFFYPDQENTRVTVDHVLLSGGGYVFRIGTPGSVSGLKVVDDSWIWGPVDVDNCGIVTWGAGNEVVTVAADGSLRSVRSLPCINR